MELDGLSLKFALLHLGVESMFPEGRQDFLYVHMVKFKRCREDENIIKIHYKEVIQKFSTNVIYEVLKSVRGIGKSEKHHKVFKMSETGSEGRLSLVSFSNLD